MKKIETRRLNLVVGVTIKLAKMLSSHVVTHKLASNLKYLNLKLNRHMLSVAGVCTSLQFICL